MSIQNQRPSTASPRAGPTLVRVALRLAAIVVVVVALNRLAAWAIDPEDFAPGHFAASDPMVLTAAGFYALLLALPFVPGVEIGAAMLSVLGPPVAALIYGATLLGLVLAFAAGRLIPVRTTVGVLRRIGLHRVADGIARMAQQNGAASLAGAADGFSAPVARFLLRYPEVALILLFNLPGNVLIGGGGGIAMMAGLSRVMPVYRFVLATAIAVAPVPLAVYYFGIDPFQ